MKGKFFCIVMNGYGYCECDKESYFWTPNRLYIKKLMILQTRGHRILV